MTLSLTISDVRELDDGDGVGHGNLPVTPGKGFSWRPVIIGKIQPASFGLFLLSLFTIPVYIFARPYLFSNPKVTGRHFSGSTMTMKMMTWMLLIKSFFIMSFTGAWSLLEASPV